MLCIGVTMLDYRAHTFLVAYRLRSYTAAARELHITQPAVSQHIKHLEAHYGCPLFTTRGRTVAATAAGDLLYQRLSAMANDERRLEAELAHAGEGTVPPLRLGCTRTIADYVAPRLLAAHAERHPEQPVHLQCGNTSELLGCIETGSLDVALIEGPYNRSDFDGVTLSDEPYLAVASAQRGAELGRPRSIDELLGQPLIVREEGSGTREILERNLTARGLDLDSFASVTEMASIPVIKELVRTGRGVTFIYRAAVEHELAAGAIADVTPIDFAITHHFDLVWQRGSIYEPQFRALFSPYAR